MLKSLFTCSRSITFSNKFSVINYYYPDVIDLSSTKDTFKASDLIIEKTTQPLKKPPVDASIMKFGQFNTDHILEIDWTEENGWGKPHIHPFRPFQIHPFSSCLHYAVQCFEGTKAFKNSEGQIRWFRPDCNMYRMKKTAQRISLPDFDGEEFIKAIEKLIQLDADWVPNIDEFSAYLRPTFIATEETLGVRAPRMAKLFCCISPVGPYFPTGFKPVKVIANYNYVRAGPYGVGEFKVGGNYAPTIQPNKQHELMGFNQTVWMLPNGMIQEMGVCNLFMVFKNKDDEIELVTPKLDGTILPGVTRDSVLKIASNMKNIKVSERNIFIDEFIEAFEQKRLIEMFGCGTATKIIPIQTLAYKDKLYNFEIDEKLQSGKFSYEIYKILSEIQVGQKPHPWVRIV